MEGKESKSRGNNSVGPAELEVSRLSTKELEDLREDISVELEKRTDDDSFDQAETVDLVSGRFVEWSALSAHPNRKAVKPWILKVTGLHEKYTVDGDWLDKQNIDGSPYMDISDVEPGDIIKVSGASHNNKKHRYYRVVHLTDEELYYEPEWGLDEADVIEEVA